MLAYRCKVTSPKNFMNELSKIGYSIIIKQLDAVATSSSLAGLLTSTAP